ncbi:hypothetical protein R1sor_011878 [Riccia sorocarpa]|uniref:Endonuclease/exonuclease/phosphatase domain-containing protein n=1 Tax=Riccia sorocarpa TaxID=122646 RepID=A0ABD3I257_9MARC
MKDSDVNPFSWGHPDEPSGVNQLGLLGDVQFSSKMDVDRLGGRSPKMKEDRTKADGFGKRSARSKGKHKSGLPKDVLASGAFTGNRMRKRRALAEVDLKGCRVPEKMDNFLKIYDGRINRTRKSRDDGLCQVRQCVSWNARGLARPNKAKAVKSWLQNRVTDRQVVALQEIKTARWGLKRWLDNVCRRGKVIFDPQCGSRGGTALILHESLEVVTSGIGGQERLAWAMIKLGDETIGLMSLHAPNKRRLRLAFWRQLKEIMGNDKWIMMGDFNQVELPDDSRGRSALISGREERFWRQFTSEAGLVDGFLCWASVEGWRFTRVAKRRGRRDAACLDRMYISGGTSWIDHVREVNHHHNTAVSDHVPVSMVLQIMLEEENRKGETYFKMNFHELSDPMVLEKIKRAWEHEPLPVRDDRRRWARGWARVKHALKELRVQRDLEKRQEGSVAQEVEWRRSRISDESTEAELEALNLTEQKLKALELREARLWRIRSREKWLREDEVPSRYFFAKLKARWARESLEALVKEDGETTTDREEIMNEIHQFYQTLYSAEPENEERCSTREEVVGLISKKLYPEESRGILELPEKQEIQEVVFGMKRNKAPGGDGVITEILRMCWPFVGDDCVKLIHEVWAKKRLLPVDLQSVIKLIPKGG